MELMIMNQRDHWNSIYTKNPAEKVGWYKPHLDLSLKWIREIGVPKDAAVIDIGGGASTLVDDLLDEGYKFLTVLDISEKALLLNKTRLGDRADQISWIEGDINSIDLPANQYDLWHDRAVFHFLTTSEKQILYKANLKKALRPGGHLIIGTFSPEAPPTCSGLPVQRYSADDLQEVLGDQFELIRCEKSLHITPGGVEQMYLYGAFVKN